MARSSTVMRATATRARVVCVRRHARRRARRRRSVRLGISGARRTRTACCAEPTAESLPPRLAAPHSAASRAGASTSSRAGARARVGATSSSRAAWTYRRRLATIHPPCRHRRRDAARVCGARRRCCRRRERVDDLVSVFRSAKVVALGCRAELIAHAARAPSARRSMARRRARTRARRDPAAGGDAGRPRQEPAAAQPRQRQALPMPRFVGAAAKPRVPRGQPSSLAAPRRTSPPHPAAARRRALDGVSSRRRICDTRTPSRRGGESGERGARRPKSMRLRAPVGVAARDRAWRRAPSSARTSATPRGERRDSS